MAESESELCLFRTEFVGMHEGRCLGTLGSDMPHKAVTETLLHFEFLLIGIFVRSCRTPSWNQVHAFNVREGYAVLYVPVPPKNKLLRGTKHPCCLSYRLLSDYCRSCTASSNARMRTSVLVGPFQVSSKSSIQSFSLSVISAASLQHEFPFPMARSPMLPQSLFPKCIPQDLCLDPHTLVVLTQSNMMGQAT